MKQLISFHLCNLLILASYFIIHEIPALLYQYKISYVHLCLIMLRKSSSCPGQSVTALRFTDLDCDCDRDWTVSFCFFFDFLLDLTSSHISFIIQWQSLKKQKIDKNNITFRKRDTLDQINNRK